MSEVNGKSDITIIKDKDSATTPEKEAVEKGQQSEQDLQEKSGRSLTEAFSEPDVPEEIEKEKGIPPASRSQERASEIQIDERTIEKQEYKIQALEQGEEGITEDEDRGEDENLVEQSQRLNLLTIDYDNDINQQLTDICNTFGSINRLEPEVRKAVQAEVAEMLVRYLSPLSEIIVNISTEHHKLAKRLQDFEEGDIEIVTEEIEATTEADDVKRSLQGLEAKMQYFEEIEKKEQYQNLKEQVAKIGAQLSRLQGVLGSLQPQIERFNEFKKLTTQQVRGLEKFRTSFPELFEGGGMAIKKLNNEITCEQILLQAQIEEQRKLEEDQARFDMLVKEKEAWEQKGKEFHGHLEQATIDISTIITKSQEFVNTFPEKVQAIITNNQKGLNLIGKMLDRLIHQPPQSERLNSLLSEIIIEQSLVRLPQKEWQKLVVEDTTEEDLRKKVEHQLKDIGNTNYGILSDLSNLVEKRKKLILKFIKEQLLPSMDGVDSGRQPAKERVDEAQNSYLEYASKLQEWLDTYGKLHEAFQTLVESVGVRQIQVEIGMPIDYERHEPFGTEVDMDMEDEHIKEVIRAGYKYINPNTGDAQVLRPAQVVVVKNPKQGSDEKPDQ